MRYPHAATLLLLIVGGWLILNSLFDVLLAARRFAWGLLAWTLGRFSRD